MKYLLPIMIALLASSTAHAETKLRGDVFCFPAKDVPKLVDKLAEVDADRRDVVNVSLKPKFLIKDGGIWPESFYLAKDGEPVVDMPISREDGSVPNFLAATRANPDTDICTKDPSRADRPEYDEGLYFEMGLSPLFLNNSGTYSIDELEKGSKDGKRFYKKMIPSVARMFMPDTDYLAVRYDDFRTSGAQIFAKVDEVEVPLSAEAYKDMHVVSLEALEDMNASALIVRGGAFQLQPTVSIETLKRFGWGQEDE